jgi:hypothetical protein
LNDEVGTRVMRLPTVSRAAEPVALATRKSNGSSLAAWRS